MTCAGCATSLAGALQALPEVTAAAVSFESARATVTLRDPRSATLEARLVKAIAAVGYEGTVLPAGGAPSP